MVDLLILIASFQKQVASSTSWEGEADLSRC